MCFCKNLDNNKVFIFNNFTRKSSKEVEILDIKIDNNLNFNNHIKSTWNKVANIILEIFKHPRLISDE